MRKALTKVTALLLALVTVLGTMWIPSLAATAEATLVITPEGGTATTSNGTFQEMYEKMVTEAKKLPTVKTTYVITLNSNASYTTPKTINGNENCFITIDLNGYTLNASKINSNLFAVLGQDYGDGTYGSITITVDGGGNGGRIGKIINSGIAGGLVYVNNKANNNNSKVYVTDIELVYSNMAQGYNAVDNPNKNEYPNQPMMHVAKGDIYCRNMKMVYTGEDAVAVVGSEGAPDGDITKMYVRMIQYYGGGEGIFEDCTFIDTNTKGITTHALNVSTGGTHVVVKNCTMDTTYGLFAESGTYAEFYSCDVTAKDEPYRTKGSAAIFDTVTTTDWTINSQAGSVLFAETASGETVIYTTSTERGIQNRTWAAEGYVMTGPVNGRYDFSPATDVDATLSVMNGSSHNFFAGTLTDMVDKVKSETTTGVAVKTDIVLTLQKNANLKSLVYLNGSEFVSVTVELNGKTLDTTAAKNNIFQLATSVNFHLNGADKDGNNGKIYNAGHSGGLVYTQNKTENSGINALVENVDYTATNMSQGYSTGKYKDQPMCHFNVGTLTMKNVNMTFTGADATAVEGSAGGADLTKMVMRFMQCNGSGTVNIEDCTFTDTNTKGIMTIGIEANSGSNVTVKNSKFKTYTGIKASNGVIDVRNCEVEASYTVFDGASIIKVTDTVAKAGASGKLINSCSKLYFLYGEGKNELHSTADISGTYTVQTGYTLVKANGVYTMKGDDSVEATLAVNPYGGEPSFKTGTFQDMYTQFTKKPTVPTENTIVLNKDSAYTTFASHTVNSNFSLKIDLNGKNLLVSQSGNIFQIVGNYNLELDGADKDGNVGLIKSTGTAGALFYPRANNGLNDNTVIYAHDVNLLYTNMSDGYSNNAQYSNQPMGNIPAGTVTYEKIKITYTGEDATAVAGSTNGADITKLTTAFVNVSGKSNVTIKDCEFIDENTKGIQTIGIKVTGEDAKVTVENTKIKAHHGIRADKDITLNNCEIECTTQIFGSAGVAYVTDSVLKTESTLTTSSARVYFNYGTGKTEIYTSDDKMLSGSYWIADDSAICTVEEGHFMLGKGNEGYSSVTLPAIFADGMVLQRDKQIDIYGYCALDGAQVKVTFDGKTVNATVVNGRWDAIFDAMPAKKGLSITVEQLGTVNSVVHTVNDVDVGEIWLIAGQSNAEYEVHKMKDAEEYYALADNYDNIKIYAATKSALPVANLHGGGKWAQVTSETLQKNGPLKGEVSALGYVMATRLAIELGPDVTVAILDINYGGSSIFSWTREDYLRAELGDVDHTALIRLDAYRDFYLENGRMPTSVAELNEYITKPYSQVAAADYYGMLYSLTGYAVKGAVWMQGEGNSSEYAIYEKYYRALANTFRDTFNDDNLPMIVVQIHPFGSGAYNDFRAVQYDMVENDKNSFLVGAVNEGPNFSQSDFDNNSTNTKDFVHTSAKAPIGHRLADSALYNVYAVSEYADRIAPKVSKVEVSGNTLTVTFNTDVTTELGTAPVGFEIAGNDKNFVKAEAVAVGKQIMLTASGVDAPKYVRYGYGNFSIELEDGTLIMYNESFIKEYTSEKLVLTYNGKDYTIVPDTTKVIRSKFIGNVTGITGIPLPIFYLEVGYDTSDN